MKIMRKDVNGEFDNDDKFEVESLEAYAKARNDLNKEVHGGTICSQLKVVNPHTIEHRTPGGKLIESYHVVN